MTAGSADKLRMELRRGVLVLAVLAALRQEHYGYSLRKYLINGGLDIDEGTLYPLLRRLESQGLLGSEWRESEGRRRRFYLISEQGQQRFTDLAFEWRTINQTLTGLMEK